MHSQDENEIFQDTVASPSTPISQAALQLSGSTDKRMNKKRKLPESTQLIISEKNQASFKVLKKLSIQMTRTDHYINYLKKCERTKTIPKALRVTLTPQVLVVNSLLQLKWEQAQIDFGLTLTQILLDYWEKDPSQKNLTSLMDLLRKIQMR